MNDLRHVEQMWADDEASRALGMEILDLQPDHATVRMTITEAMMNGHANAHGGYLFVLADSAFALACNSRGRAVAAGADIIFVAAAHLGDVLVADAAQRTAYKRSGITDVTITRESDGALIAEFRGRSRSLADKPGSPGDADAPAS